MHKSTKIGTGLPERNSQVFANLDAEWQAVDSRKLIESKWRRELTEKKAMDKKY